MDDHSGQNMSQLMVDTHCMATACQQAVEGADEGGVPVGAALFLNLDSPERIRLLGAGRNQEIQKGCLVLHGEIAALEAAGRLPADVYRKCTMVSTVPACSLLSDIHEWHVVYHTEVSRRLCCYRQEQ